MKKLALLFLVCIGLFADDLNYHIALQYISRMEK